MANLTRNLAIGAMVILGGLQGPASSFAAPPDYAACYNRRVAEFRSTQTPFAVDSEVVCPTAEGNVAAPSAHTFDRESVLTYKAPTGYIIGPRSVQVVVLSSDGGSNGAPEVYSDHVQLSLSCKGKVVGEGEAYHRVRLSGVLTRTLSPETMAEFASDCSHCAGRTNC